MRRRLIVSTLLVAVAAVLLLGLPLAIVMSRLVTDEAARELQRDASTLAKGIQARERDHQPPLVDEDAPPGDYVVIQQNGRVVRRSGQPPPRSRVSKAMYSAGGFTVTVETDSSATDGREAGALALVGGLGLAAIGVAVGLAVLQARRFIRPLEDLAGAAEELGSGVARPVGRRYGIHELDQVAEGLDGSARRISELLTAEREFASDASHQLRTPLTALSMRLEEMIAAAEDPDAVRAEGEAALSQTERLTDVVSQLLRRARRVGPALPECLLIDDVLAQQVAEWDPAFRRAHRKLEVTGEKGLRGYATIGTLAQVIATLLDNALTHGAGTVTIRTSRTRGSAVIEVRDEGPGVAPDLAPHIFERNVTSSPQGTGLGLALARTMAAADGARVVLVRPKPAVFAVFLPLTAPLGEPEEPVVAGPA